MDEFEKWQESDGHSAIRIRAAQCEVGSLDYYARAAFKAGREAGMREAAGLCQSHEPKDFTTAGIITRAKCAEVILSAIGGYK